MRYIELRVTVDPEFVDIISTALFDAGAEGVAIEDPRDYETLKQSKLFWDYIDENAIVKGDNAVIKTLIEPEKIDDVMSKFKDEIALYASLNTFKYDIRTEEVEKNDWNEEWKKRFKPIRTANITIIPAWEEYKQNKKEKVLKINPSIAFGSGEHATTRMCLDYMDVEGKDVIDVGCGSGILGLSAKVLGAKTVLMVDIDEDAVKNAKENAKLNNINDVIIKQGDLIADEKADVIFANLTADILMRLSENIKNNLRTGGKLIVSGIISEREEEVSAKFKEVGFQVVEMKKEEPWVAMVLKQNAN